MANLGDAYNAALRCALARRGLPDEVAAAYREGSTQPRDERYRYARFIRDAQTEAHRVSAPAREYA